MPDNIQEIRSKDITGRDVIYYVNINSKGMIYLKHDQKENPLISLKDYGDVLASCYGSEPTERVKQILKEKYNYQV